MSWNRSHGQSRGRNGKPSRTYASWSSMRNRCDNPRNRRYPHYGHRGIRVCERWDSFEMFLADMGERPPGTSIDRIDNDGNYEPGNCRWATHEQQQRNRSISKLSPFDVAEIHRRCSLGETQTSVASAFGVTQGHVSRIRAGLNWIQTGAGQ